MVGGWLSVPLASGVDFASMLDFPDWTARVFVYAGLCLLLLGGWPGSAVTGCSDGIGDAGSRLAVAACSSSGLRGARSWIS